MSGLANPRKDFRWALELNGANAFLLQEVQLPMLEQPILKHGAPVNIPDAKTPGKMVVGEMVVKKLMPALSADGWAWDWFGSAVAGVKKDFIKAGALKDLGPDGLTTIQTWVLGDIWPTKIEHANRQLLAPGANMIETVTFAVQFFYPKDSIPLQALLAGSAARAGGLAFLLGTNS